jgi:hypothetical protein
LGWGSRLYKTTKPNTKCSPLQAFSEKAAKPHRGLKQKLRPETFYRNNSQLKLHYFHKPNYKPFTITSFPKKLKRPHKGL